MDKKSLLSTIFVLFLIPLMAQKTRYLVIDLSLQSENFGKSLIRYVGDLPRKNSLDSVASLRADYFLGVLKSSSSNRTLGELFKTIPNGRKAHFPLFGDSVNFVPPCCIEYTSPLVKIRNEKIYGKAEIMQQILCKENSKERMNSEDVIQKLLKRTADEFGPDFIMDGYKTSSSHDDVIKKYATQNYGTSTKMLISERYDNKLRSWIYQAIIYNSTIFGKSY